MGLFGRRTTPVALALTFALGPRAAEAGIVIVSPPDGDTRVASPCPLPACSAMFSARLEVTGDPLDSVDFEFTPDGGSSVTTPVCQPADPVAGTPGCPIPPTLINTGFVLQEGTWTVVARARRGTAAEASDAIRVTVLPASATPPGTITLSSVAPLSAAPAIVARVPGPGYPAGILTVPGETTITGTHLDDNALLDVYASPVRPGEPLLAADSALPVADWCKYPARILGRGGAPGGESFLRVEVPALPLEAPTTCGAPPGPAGSIFTKQWRWLIHDRWARPERVHEWWAIPTPQALPWHDAPPFRMAKPLYPLIDGFGFPNKPTDPRYYEFLTVFGDNAYVCVGALGSCATRAPDPLYHVLSWPVYSLVIGSAGGSCSGLAATSLLMSREELQTELFAPDVHYPVGFDQAGDPALYSEPDGCTPSCSPPKPDNLWAQIRMNHGVQLSREFLSHVVDKLGEATFDPGDVASIRGDAQATLLGVAGAPRSHVVCFFKPGNGHCVTPFAVNGNRMLVYDSNAPQDASRHIEVAGAEYRYPARAEEPNNGDAIIAFPIDIWKQGRHLLGLEALVKLVGGDAVEYLFMIAVGEGDMTVTNAAGGRWGWEQDGSFTDSLLGAVAVPSLGPQDDDARAMPLLVAMNHPPPTVEIHAKGGRYLFNAAAGGHLLQLEAADAQAGDKDVFHVAHPGGHLAGFDFTPQRAASHFVPRVGLVLGEQGRALFHFLGLSVAAGRRVAFGADKQARAVSYENDGARPTHHVLALDHVAGQAESHGRMIYGPFEVPQGARQTVRLAAWPDVTQVVSELDLDRDGTPDHTQLVPGRPVSTPVGEDTAANLSLAQAASSASVARGESATFAVTVSNAGPDTASEVKLLDVVAPYVTISEATTTHGQCQAAPAALECDIGTLVAGESATVTYVVTAGLHGTLANGATVLGKEGDPDLTDNTAVGVVELPVRVDVIPGRRPNVVTVGSNEPIPVAILGEPALSVQDVEGSTLAFGPAGAPPAPDVAAYAGSAADGTGGETGAPPGLGPGEVPPAGDACCGTLMDVNRDGQLDLVVRFRTSESGITVTDTQACVRGSFRDGRSFTGCDAILTAPGGADQLR